MLYNMVYRLTRIRHRFALKQTGFNQSVHVTHALYNKGARILHAIPHQNIWFIVWPELLKSYFKPYECHTYSNEKLPNIVTHTINVQIRKKRFCWQSVSCIVGFVCLTTIHMLSVVSVVAVTHHNAVRDVLPFLQFIVPGSSLGSGKDFFVCFLCCCVFTFLSET